MTRRLLLASTTILMALLLGACDRLPQTAALPTLQPTAVLPTRAPTIAPRESTVPAEPTQAAADAGTAAELPTPLPTQTPRPTQTPEAVEAAVNIQAPAEGSQVLAETSLRASGFGQLNPGQTIWVSLFTSDGRLVLDTQATVTPQAGNTVTWEAAFIVPPQVNGLLQLVVTARNEENQILADVSRPIMVGVDTESSDRYMVMYEPTLGQNGVAGHFLLMQGFTVLPSANRVTVEIWIDECQTRISQVSFGVGGGGPWYGLPAIPDDITGPACAIAYTGVRGESNWREAQTTINILAEDDPAASGIFMVRPREDAVFAPGASFTAFGVAFNAVEDQLSATITLADGQLLAQEIVEVSPRGYWEVEITLPPDVEGEAALSVITGQAGDFGHAALRRLITIES